MNNLIKGIKDWPINPSIILAGVVLLVAVAWVFSGQIFGNSANSADESVADASADAAVIPSVRVKTIVAEQRQADVVVRGRTEAIRKVDVRARTIGPVIAVHAEKGDFVKEGDVICELKIDAREAEMEKANALVRQRELEYNGSKKLKAKGVRSETQVAADKAAFETAKAEALAMEIELENLKMTAPFDGIVDARPIEIGDLMAVNNICATVVDLDPMLVVGQVSENVVNSLRIGAEGRANLITGEELVGHIRFVSSSADEATRTFRVELEVPNTDGSVRDGITSEIYVPVKSVKAHLVSPAILVFNAQGVVGIRHIDENNIVKFQEVEILSDSPEGAWITGLPEKATIITVGQEFVSEGQKVKPTFEGDAAS